MFLFNVSKLLNRLTTKAIKGSLNLKYYLKLKKYKFLLLGKFFSVSTIVWEYNVLKKKHYVCCVIGINYNRFNTTIFCRIPLGSKNFFDIKFLVFSKSFLAIVPSKKSQLFFKAGKTTNLFLTTDLNKLFYSFDIFLATSKKSNFVKKSKIFFFVN